MLKHLSLTARIIGGYVLILALFGVVTLINFRLSDTVSSNTAFLVKSEAIIRNSAQLQRGIIDMENSFRGYLLTQDERFLSTYDSNSRAIPTLYNELQRTAHDSSVQTWVLADIGGLYTAWKNGFADSLLRQAMQETVVSTLGISRPMRAANNAESNITDLIRDKFRQFNAYEYRLRNERREALASSMKQARQLSIILIIVSIALGLLSAILMTRFILKRIKSMLRIAECIADGDLKARVEEPGRDELSRLAHSLNIMAAKLEENFTDLANKNEDLNQFAYVVSHDLKAPVRGMDMVLNWIDEDVGDRLDPQVREYHDMIRGRVKRMENLISGILELSRVGRNKKPVEKVDVQKLVEEIVESQTEVGGIRIDIKGPLPEIITERVPLQQVLSNLLSNALKYHDKEEGCVEIGCKNGDAAYTFYVKDDGPGIDPEYHGKIFEIFQTLKERDSFESTGIGLSIVKKIVTEKGGQVWVDSAPGKGATFSFTWPKFGGA